MTVAAVLAGARSFTAIGEWVADQGQDVMKHLGAPGPDRPSESTIRRVLTRVDGEVLDQLIGAFVCTRSTVIDQRRVIAIDGKTVRGPPQRSPRPRRTAPGRCAGPRRRNGPRTSRSERQVQRNLGRTNTVGLLRPDRGGSDRRCHARPDRHRAGDHRRRRRLCLHRQERSAVAVRRMQGLALGPSARPQHRGHRHGRRARRTIKVVQAPPGSSSPAPARSPRSGAP